MLRPYQKSILVCAMLRTIYLIKSMYNLQINLDFELLSDTNPHLDLSTKWDDFIPKFLSACTSKLKSKEQKLLLQNIMHGDEGKGVYAHKHKWFFITIFYFSLETRNLAVFKALINVLPPRKQVKRSDGVIWKPSIPDAIEGVFLQIGPINNIDVKYSKFAETSKFSTGNCQPVIGIAKDEKCFVIVEGIYYPVDSLICGVDLIFKVFYVFNLKYPPQASAFYDFIQEYFYQLPSEDKSSEVVSLLNQLN